MLSNAQDSSFLTFSQSPWCHFEWPHLDYSNPCLSSSSEFQCHLCSIPFSICFVLFSVSSKIVLAFYIINSGRKKNLIWYVLVLSTCNECSWVLGREGTQRVLKNHWTSHLRAIIQAAIIFNPKPCHSLEWSHYPLQSHPTPEQSSMRSRASSKNTSSRNRPHHCPVVVPVRSGHFIFDMQSRYKFASPIFG